jgi:NitT/TauT family transport system permease protein
MIGALPIILLIIVYISLSAARAEANSADKLLPGFGQMMTAMGRMAFSVDAISGKVLLWADTAASLQRLGLGLLISCIVTLILGLLLGVVPLFKAQFGPLVSIVAVIPPIAILPILFIVLGLGETSKVMLIVLGITPTMVRDVASYLNSLPREQFIKAQTLGASSWLLITRVALPQMMPRLIESLRFAIGPAFVYLISAEAIAADVGLGYRIFLMRRYLAMDVILPYVVWISLLAVILDFALNQLARRNYKWAFEKVG